MPDGFTDLIASAPNTYEGNKGGNVFILFGGSAGLRLDNERKLSGGAAYTDSLGQSLAVMVGNPTLIVAGAAGRTVSGKKRAGALVVWPVDAKGVPGSPTVISENTSGVPGLVESGDGFGSSLAANGSTLVVGSPNEDVGRVRDAGTITVLERTGRVSFKGVTVSQDSTGVPGRAEQWDTFGAAVSIDRGWIVASAAGEGVGSVDGAGAVQPFTYRAGSLKPVASPLIHQNVAGVPGGNEHYDKFGVSLRLLRCGAGMSVAVGTPFEVLEGKIQAGLITVVPLGKGSTCPARAYDGADLGAKITEPDMVGGGLGLIRDPQKTHDDLLAGAGRRITRIDPTRGTRLARYSLLRDMNYWTTGFSTPAA